MTRSSESSVKEMWSTFKQKQQQIVKENIPKKKYADNRKNSWILKNTIKHMKTRNTLEITIHDYRSQKNYDK